MRLPPQEAVLLRIFLGEDDRSGGRPLYEALVMKARETGMAGATVLRGPMGFGHGSRLHTAKILQLSTDLPMIIEIIDSPQKIEVFLNAIEPNDRLRIGDFGEGHDHPLRPQPPARALNFELRPFTSAPGAPESAPQARRRKTICESS